MVVVPKQPLLDWLHSVDPTSVKVTLRDLRKDPTIYLLAESESDSDAENLLASVCDQIFQEQLDAWYHSLEHWPDNRDLQNFKRWFTFSFQSMIVDLSERPLIAELL